MPNEVSPKRITTEFNLGLFAFSAAVGILTFLCSDKAHQFSAIAVLSSTGADAVRFLIELFLMAWFLKEFWARLILSLVPVRAITYAEAIAIVLLISVLRL
jgi:hypothetical protein